MHNPNLSQFWSRRHARRGIAPLLAAAAPSIIKGIGSLFGRKKKKRPAAAPAADPNDPLGDGMLRQQFGNALQGKAPGQDLINAAGKRMMAFDPQASAAASAKGSYDLMKPELDRDIDSYRQGQVSLGRLRSGFATEGEDNIMRDAFSNLNARVAQNSLTTAGMMAQNNRDIAGVGQQQYGNNMDAVTGQLDRNQAQRNAATASSDARRQGNAQIIGQVGGSLLGKVPWGKVAGWASKLF